MIFNNLKGFVNITPKFTNLVAGQTPTFVYVKTIYSKLSNRLHYLKFSIQSK